MIRSDQVRAWVRAGLSAVVVAVLLSVPAPASAQAGGGIQTNPTRINVEDALRGSDLFKSLSFLSRFDNDRFFRIEFDGEIAEWLSVVDVDRQTVLTEIPAPSRIRQDVLLRIAIPGDTPNGEYRGGVLAVIIDPDDQSEAGTSGVRLGVEIPIRLDVTGEEIVDGSFVELVVLDTEVGLPARMTATVFNRGNVLVVPEVTLEVLRAGEVEAVEKPSVDAVAPGESRRLVWTWDTTDRPTGDYTARVNVKFKDLDLGDLERPFQVAPRGTLTRSGLLESLTLSGEPQPDGIAKVEAVFVNTGEIESRGVFVGEFSKDGQLVSAVQTVERLVLPGESGTITIFLDMQGYGDYRLIGRVNFEGRDTEPKELLFSIAEPVPERQGFDLLLFGGIGVLILLAAGSGLLVRRIRRVRAKPGTPGHEGHPGIEERVRPLEKSQ